MMDAADRSWSEWEDLKELMDRVGGAEIPLMRSFWLCKKPKRKRALRDLKAYVPFS